MSTLARIKFKDAAQRPTLDFVLPGLLAKTVGMIVGQGAIGKSFLALSIGMAVALGRSVAGGLWTNSVAGKVTLVFGEDQIELLQERLYWLIQNEKLTAPEIDFLDENLDIRSGYGHDLRILARAAGGGLEHGPFYEALCEMCKGQRLLILDPLAFITDAEENNNGEMSRLMQILQTICKETGVTIIVLHHVGKSASSGDREEWAAARGASALTTACRWQVNLTLPTGKVCDEYGIDDKMRRLWVRMSVVKTNYGEPQPPQWLHRSKGGVLESREPVKVSTKKTTNSNHLKGAIDEGDF